MNRTSALNPSNRDPRSQGKAPRQAKAKEKPSTPHAVPPPDLIKCAECFHCKQFRAVQPGDRGRYYLKTRCAAGNWRRGSKPITIHIHRVLSRSRHVCGDYESTSRSAGDRLAYLFTLRQTLPMEAHMYEPDGSFVDKVELLKSCVEGT